MTSERTSLGLFWAAIISGEQLNNELYPPSMKIFESITSWIVLQETAF